MPENIYKMLYTFKRVTSKTTSILMFAIFGTIGVAVLIYTCVMRKEDHDFFDKALPLTATICEIEDHETKDSDGNVKYEHYVYVDYEVDYQSYTHVYAGQWKQGMFEGDSVEVFYVPSNPSEVRLYYDVDQAYNELVIVAIFFIVVSSLPLLVPILLKFGQNKNRNLIETGRCVWATIKSIEADYQSTTDGEHPFWVVCEEINEAEDTIYRYTSHKVYEDLTYRIKPGDHVAIYIDPKNPDRYYVNLDQIM